MANQNTAQSGGGVGLSTLLTVAFVVLKLCGVISWSWWWVLSPLWIPLVILLVVLFVALLIGSLVSWMK